MDLFMTRIDGNFKQSRDPIRAGMGLNCLDFLAKNDIFVR